MSIFHIMYYVSPIIQSSMIYIDDYQEHELALIIKYTFIIVSRAPIPTAIALVASVCALHVDSWK